MRVHQVDQGTQEWLNLRASNFTASEASAMMGASKYQSRQQLLAEKATGVREEIAPRQQAIFDKGHAAEAGARPIIEKLIGEELYPVVGTEGDLLASFDGLTIDDAIVFEHKLWNKKLAATVLADPEKGTGLELHYAYQLEQQLYVSGADKAIFVCSDGTRQNFVHCWYYSIAERRERLLEGWGVFAKDLAAYKAGIESGEIKAPVIGAVERTDDDFLKVEQEYQAALAESEAAKARLDEAKANLVKKADGVKSKGALFQVFPVKREGSISWQKAFKAFCPAVAKSDLEKFKSKGSESWTVKPIQR